MLFSFNNVKCRYKFNLQCKVDLKLQSSLPYMQVTTENVKPRWLLMRAQTIVGQNFKLFALKVLVVTYERWSLTRGVKNYSDLPWKILAFWKTGC